MPTAEISGTVRLHARCLVLGGDSPQGSLADAVDPVIVWPAGSEWNEDLQALTLPSSQHVRVGSEVNGAGAAFTVDIDVAPDAIRYCANADATDVAILRLWPSTVGDTASVGQTTSTTTSEDN
jgi:hypothetical protein